MRQHGTGCPTRYSGYSGQNGAAASYTRDWCVDGAQRVDPAVAEALVVAGQTDVDRRRLQVLLDLSRRHLHVAVPSVPNWLTISAATPAACGEAIDVPWMQP